MDSAPRRLTSNQYARPPIGLNDRARTVGQKVLAQRTRGDVGKQRVEGRLTARAGRQTVVTSCLSAPNSRAASRACSTFPAGRQSLLWLNMLVTVAPRFTPFGN